MKRPDPLRLLNAVFFDPAWLNATHDAEKKGTLAVECLLLVWGLCWAVAVNVRDLAPHWMAGGAWESARYALVCAVLVGLPVRSQIALRERTKKAKVALLGALVWICLVAAEIIYHPGTAFFFSIALMVTLYQLSRHSQMPFVESGALPAGLLVGAAVAIWGPHPLYIGIAVALGFVIGEGPAVWSNALVTAHGSAVIALWALLLTASHALGMAAGLWFDNLLVWWLVFALVLAVREVGLYAVNHAVQRILRRYLRASPRSIWEDWASGLTLWVLLATTYGALVSLPTMAIRQSGYLADAPWPELPVPHALLLAGLLIAGLTRLPIWPLEVLWAWVFQMRLRSVADKAGKRPRDRALPEADVLPEEQIFGEQKRLRRLARIAHWDRACILPQFGYRRTLRAVDRIDHHLAMRIACEEINTSDQYCDLAGSVQELAAVDPLGIQSGLGRYRGHVNIQRNYHFAATSLPPGPSAAWRALLRLIGLSYPGKQHQLAEVLETLDESIRLLEQSQRLSPHLPMVADVLALYRSLSEALAASNHHDIAAWHMPWLRHMERYPLAQPVPRILGELHRTARPLALAEGLAKPDGLDLESVTWIGVVDANGEWLPDHPPVPAERMLASLEAAFQAAEGTADEPEETPRPSLPEALCESRERLEEMDRWLPDLSAGLNVLFDHIFRHWARLIRAAQGDGAPEAAADAEEE